MKRTRKKREVRVPEIRQTGLGPHGKRLEVRARLVGTFFVSGKGIPYGPRFWEILIQVGRRRFRTTLMGSRARIAREVRELATHFAREGGAR